MLFKKPKTYMESWSLPTNHGLRYGECPPRLPSAAPVSRAGPARTRTRRSGPACLPDNATLSLPIFDTVINGKTVIGSIVGTRNDLADVFALHAAGRTTVIAVDRKIDEVNQSIDDVLAGTVPARVVFQF